MPAQSPEEIYDRFLDRYLAKDVAGMLALYEPGACFVSRDGSVARTNDGIGAELSALLSLGGRFWLGPATVVTAGDIAQLHGDWSIDGSGPDGTLTVSSRSSDIARRQPDGCWLLVVDNPFGGVRA